MNVQLDLFDDEFNKEQRQLKDKMEILAKGKWSRGLKGKEISDAYHKKVSELFGDED